MSIHLWEPVVEPDERFPSCHCSVILELGDGDLLVGYYAGSGEARPDTAYVPLTLYINHRFLPRAARPGLLCTGMMIVASLVYVWFAASCIVWEIGQRMG